MSVIIRGFLLSLIVIVSGCADRSPLGFSNTSSCRLVPLRDVAMRVEQNRILIPGAINGFNFPMQIDTGADLTILDRGAAAALKLPIDSSGSAVLVGTTGRSENRSAIVQSMLIAGQPWRRSSLLTGDVPQPNDRNSHIAALVGSDWLAEFDVELDFARGRMILWKASRCSGDFVPWTEPHFVVPLRSNQQDLLSVDIEIDGRPIDALLDTGAQRSVMDASVARRLGIGADDLQQGATGRITGVDGKSYAARDHVFGQVRIGADRLSPFTMTISENRMAGSGLLLGMDYLGQRHLWISYASRQMFVARLNR